MAVERLQHRLDRFAPYSYRADPLLAHLPDGKPIIVFDGVCVLCTGFARFVVARDPEARFRLTAAQSATGQALFRHYGLDPVDVRNQLAHRKRPGLRQARHGETHFTEARRPVAGGGGSVTLSPGAHRRRALHGIACNRYRLFGRTEVCMVPPPDWRERVIE